jgi:hypothetical protein
MRAVVAYQAQGSTIPPNAQGSTTLQFGDNFGTVTVNGLMSGPNYTSGYGQGNGITYNNILGVNGSQPVGQGKLGDIATTVCAVFQCQ